MIELFANGGDLDPRSATFDLGLHCLPNTLLGISTLQWVKTVNENLKGYHTSRAL